MQNTLLFYGQLPDTLFPDKRKLLQLDIGALASASVDAFYVLDFRNRCFDHISSHDMFLCGHTKKEIRELGYHFYTKIVHPDDIALLQTIHLKILRTLVDSDEYCGEIQYFSFNIRIMDWPQYKKRTEYIMVEHKLVPVFMDGKPGFGICILTCSHAEQSGNLRLYCQNDSVFEEYSFPYQKWQTRKAVHLTDLEKVILKLAKQGLTNRAIADKLCISDTHLTHTLTDLYEKLGVNSMRKALICVTNSLLLFKPDRREVDEVAEISDSVEKKDTKPSKFSKKLTDEVLQLIKNKVNAGQTHRHIARELGIDEKTVRNAIKSGFFPPKT